MKYGDFFWNAIAMISNRTLIIGKICGVWIEKSENPIMRDIWYLDKLWDGLVKAMERILRKQGPNYE